jgi:Skp family chaperone for outer membrane proteins
VAREKRLAFVLDGDAAGLAWADPALDITADIIARLNTP